MIDENNSSIQNPVSLPSMAALLAFELAASHESFARAAKEMGRTPSAVSHAIKELEDSLGVHLFERVGRVIKLTDVGRDYLAAVHKSLTDLRAATRAVQTTRDRNTIRLSALPFFTSVILLPNLNRFHTEHPGFELRLETSNAYADVLNGEADIALRFGADHSAGLECLPLIQVRGQPVASEGYLDGAPALETLEDFNQHTLLFVRQNPSAWQDWYASHGGGRLDAKNAIVFDSVLGALDAVKAGLGIAMSMQPLISAFPGYGDDIFPVFPEAQDRSRHYNFVCRRAALEERKVQVTLQWLREALSSFVSS